jgi:TorA maturation chaperone TorD
MGQEKVLEKLTQSLKQVYPRGSVFSKKMSKVFMGYSDEELSVEFARLFVGPFELKAPPYGSVYLDEGRRVMGDSTMEIVKLYHETGLVINDNFKDLPDHVAVELEYMYYLIFQEVEFLQSAQSDKAAHFVKYQRIFLDRFLGKWISAFCEKVHENTENEFYKLLSTCTRDFVLYDHQYINLLTGDGNSPLSEETQYAQNALINRDVCVCAATRAPVPYVWIFVKLMP